MLSSNYCSPSTYLIDLDGVIYRDNHLIEGVLRALEILNQHQKSYYFVTNNSASTRASLHKKLSALGLVCQPAQVLASGFLLAEYIVSNPEYSMLPLYLIGSSELRAYFLSLGLDLVDHSQAKIVVACLDFEFNYRQLEIASAALQKQALFFVANLDSSFPCQLGCRRPGLGAIVQAITTASQRSPDLIFGKPNRLIVDSLMADLEPTLTVVIGDEVNSDIQLAKNLGCQSVLIAPHTPSNFPEDIFQNSFVFPNLLSAICTLEKCKVP